MFIFNSLCLAGLLLFSSTLPTLHNSLLSLADQFFNARYYDEAITEYKRFIFLSAQLSGSDLSYAYHKIGLAYRNQHLWKECIDAFQKSIQSELEENLRNERRIDLSIALIASGRSHEAEFILLKVEMYASELELKKKAAFFRGVSALYSSKWAEAREAFQVYFSHLESSSKDVSQKVDRLLAEAQNLKLKSPRLAKALSTILPGAGQIYAGDWWSGINALAINSATTYLLIHDLSTKDILDAIFNSIFLFERFYSGNRQKAEEAAQRYNQRLYQKLTAQILKTLEKN